MTSAGILLGSIVFYVSQMYSCPVSIVSENIIMEYFKHDYI